MLHQIGIGALGPVFRTYEPTRDRLVAVKVFRLDIVPEQAQALAEALGRAASASLFHPSIVEPIAAGVEGTVAYRAEEYVAAESLDVAMRHYAPASIDKVLPFITQLAGAIDFARAAGVGHGGLHPRDIFVTPDDSRATGFGVIEALEEVGIRAPVRRPYTAPERIEGKPWSTPTDVFSLAAITFELLTGRRPAGTGALLGALPEGKYSTELHSVLARAMHDDPLQRYASALGFAAALESASHGRIEPQPTAEVPSSPPAVVVPPESIAAAPPFAAPTREPEPAPPPAPPPATLVQQAARKSELTLFDTEEQPAGSPPPGRIADFPQSDARLARRRPEPKSEPELGREPKPLEGREPVEPVEPLGRLEPLEPLEALQPLERLEPLELLEPSPQLREPLETPLEAPLESPPPEAHMYDDASDSSRPAVLPIALVGVLGLLGGFAGGYFVGSRDRVTPEASTSSAAVSTPAASPTASSATSGAATGVTAPAAGSARAATRDQPGQYSEQKVSPAPSTAASVATEPKTTEPPPVVQETAPAKGERANRTASSASRERATQTAGTVTIKSAPSHAGVMLNGKWRGRTPLTLDRLAFGRYVVRVVRPGYRVAQEDFTLSTHATDHTFNPRLEAVPSSTVTRRETPAGKAGAGNGEKSASAAGAFVGTLYVDSRPRGASVLLDGKDIGVTPLSLDNVAVGSHVVRIEMAGKRSWSSTTRVTAGETARVTGSLEDK